MDSAVLAVAGIALLVMGVVGFAAVVLFFGAAAFRYSVLPTLGHVARRLVDESRAWLAPPNQPRPVLVRTPTRTSPHP